MHLDYENHPFIEKERRLNIILYLSEEWNGQTELCDANIERCIVKSPVRFNTAILFKTNEISWHGVPERILYPEEVLRKTLTYYYISPLSSNSNSNKFGNDGSGYRTKASFIKRPSDQHDERMETLYKIHPLRRITTQDIEEIWPEWNEKDF